MTNFKDLFSIQAKDYVKYRPTYPRELFDYLSSITRDKNLAWDVGTGNGQAAVELAKNFRHVFATDPSEKQISEAIKKKTLNTRLSQEKIHHLPVTQPTSSPLPRRFIGLIIKNSQTFACE